MEDRRYLILGAAGVAACLALLGALKLRRQRPPPSGAAADRPADYLRALHDELAAGRPWGAAGGTQIRAESVHFRDDGVLVLDSVDSERGVVIASPVTAIEDFEGESSAREDGTWVIEYRRSGSPTTRPRRPARLAARQAHIWIADGQLNMRLIDMEMTAGGAAMRAAEQLMRIPLAPESGVAVSEFRAGTAPSRSLSPPSTPSSERGSP